MSTGVSFVNAPVAVATPSAAPEITSFSPRAGSAGVTVTITGLRLSGVTSVLFNGIASETVSVVSATSVTAVIPTGTTTGPISVYSPQGNSSGPYLFTLGDGGEGGATVTSVTGTAPIAVASGTTTPVVSISAASAIASGSMSSAHYSKLDGIEALADVTDAANVAAALAAGEPATSTATVVTGAILKNSGSGTYDHLDVGGGDSPLAMIAIVVAGRTGGGAFTAQFRPGGQNTLLSDGSGTIAAGAFVIPSDDPTTPGRVMQGTEEDKGIIGINVGGVVAATLDAPVTVR